MDALEQVVGHSQAIHTSAVDFVDAIHKRNKTGMVIDAATIGEEAFNAFNDLQALTHPHLGK